MIKSIDDIPNETYNRNLRILYYSVEKGIEDWYYNFYGAIQNGKINEARYKERKEAWKVKDKCHWWYMPKFFLNLLATIWLEDTAYRDLTNCMMMRLQGEMNKSWNPEIQHRFPLYVNLKDGYMPFFIEWMRIAGGGNVILEVPKEPVKIELKTKKTKSIKLNLEAVERIESLSKEDKPRFLDQLNKFLVRTLGQEKVRVCPGCEQKRKFEEFSRSGTTEFWFCDECSKKKPEIKKKIEEIDKAKVSEAIDKARLGKVNAYTNADFEGFIDEDILKKELEIDNNLNKEEKVPKDSMEV